MTVPALTPRTTRNLVRALIDECGGLDSFDVDHATKRTLALAAGIDTTAGLNKENSTCIDSDRSPSSAPSSPPPATPETS